MSNFEIIIVALGSSLLLAGTMVGLLWLMGKAAKWWMIALLVPSMTLAQNFGTPGVQYTSRILPSGKARVRVVTTAKYPMTWIIGNETGTDGTVRKVGAPEIQKGHGAYRIYLYGGVMGHKDVVLIPGKLATVPVK